MGWICFYPHGSNTVNGTAQFRKVHMIETEYSVIGN